MRAGKLRHRVTLLRLDDSARDTFGDASGSYVTIADGLWASIEPLSGSELWTAQQVRADVTHKVTLRYNGDVTGKCRIEWDGRFFELGPPMSTEERLFDLVLTAVERGR